MEKGGRTNQTVMEVEVDSIGRLSRELIIDILSRLSVKNVCKFRCVSKQWLNLMSGPHFMKLHRNQSQRNPLLLICSDYFFLNCKDELEKDENTTVHISAMDMKGKVHTEHKFIVDDHISESIYCSGLIFLEGLNDVYVCNPTKGEFVRLHDNNALTRVIAYGFGFLPSTNEYKLIRLCRSLFDRDADAGGAIQCEIHTLRNGGVISSCRSLEISWPSETVKIGKSVCVNGVLYWMIRYRVNDEVKIMSLDLEKEECGTDINPPPLRLDQFKIGYLQELKGVLCFVVSLGWTSTMDVWMLKDGDPKKSRFWEKKYSIDFSTHDGFPQSVSCSPNYRASPMAVDIQDGEILFELKQKSFCYYNIETKSFRAAGLSNDQSNRLSTSIFFESFFSLGSG